MDAKSRIPARLAVMAAAASACMLMVFGCALDKDGIQPGKTFGRVGGHSGEILEPKRCLLKVAILSRPFGDPAINEAVWKSADEQIIPLKDRRAWEVNGLRVGRIIGEFPLELEAVMKDTTTRQKVNPSNFFVESGEPTLIKISDPVEEASLLLNRDNRIFGNDYKDVSGYFRATAVHEGPNNVTLRLVPEIHYGPIQAHVPVRSECGPDRPPGIQDQQRAAGRYHPRIEHQPDARAGPGRRDWLPSGAEAQSWHVLLHSAGGS